MGEETYRIKWRNQELSDFVSSRRSKAQMLRSDAATLIKRAEQVEEEAREWEMAFETVEAVDETP